jgi:TetR/AcrR family transcriptional regulator, transcriptional repressor for nem operon
MRYDAEHKQRTRARVLKEAAAAIRENGPERVAVAAVMAKAGLTHGGFYAHFASKDELLVAAIGQMFDEALGNIESLMGERAPGEGLARYIGFYLSALHRDRPAEGCPLPTMSADLPRLTPEARAAFEHGAARVTTAIATRLEALGHPEPGLLAVSVLSELVGAMVLARSIADDDRSLAILRASRHALRARLKLPPAPKE